VLPGELYVLNEKIFQPPVPAAKARQSEPAAKVFDQFYYLGENWVSAWALNTPDGIILFDTLPSDDEAATYIEGGLRRMGLDPRNIKYIVITHGHADHYGGARYLQEKYHAKVLMSAVDWQGMQAGTLGATTTPQPAHDVDILADGQTLTLGGVTVTFYITPGHTPGTVSTLIPVTDHGRPHVISFVGGTGLTMPHPSQGGAQALRSALQTFARASLAANADVLITSHPFLDDAWDKAKLSNGSPGGPNPWVSSKDAVLRYYASAIEAAYAIEAYDRVRLTATGASVAKAPSN
jgi:metallo-beta-lactamase class B